MKLARGGLRPSRRATRAAEAVVERIIGTYLKPGVINLAPGSVHWAPPAELLQRCPATRTAIMVMMPATAMQG